MGLLGCEASFFIKRKIEVEERHTGRGKETNREKERYNSQSMSPKERQFFEGVTRKARGTSLL